MKKNENILIIKHGALGDLIQAEGIIKSIRYEHKNAKLVLLTSKKFINLMSMCPYIDDQLIDNRSSFLNIFSSPKTVTPSLAIKGTFNVIKSTKSPSRINSSSSSCVTTE